ncbi:hypothetical protein HYS28_02170 [Candidatus Uhrbacteria bacterium]|nr:hypothetical protein [Candidatus Uhrbacteria bacterium]
MAKRQARPRQSKPAQQATLKVGDIEREYGVKLDAPADQTVSAYLKDLGLPSLSKAVEGLQTL